MEWAGGQGRLYRRDLTIVASPESFRGWKSAQPGSSRRARSDRWDGELTWSGAVNDIVPADPANVPASMILFP